MSNYVKSFNETFNFDGDTVTVNLKQLSRVDALRLMPYASKMDSIRRKLNVDMSAVETAPPEELAQASMDFANEAADILRNGNYVVSINGLTIEGKEVRVEDAEFNDIVLTDFYFTGVVAAISGALLSKSTLSAEEVKKSEEQLPITTS